MIMKTHLVGLSSALMLNSLLAPGTAANAAETQRMRAGPEGIYSLWYQRRENAEVFLQQPYVVGGQMVYQWRDLEPEKGKYDFSKMATELDKYGQMKIYTTIQINGNQKPEWLFREVPCHPEKFSLQVRDGQGSLMYWHPTHRNAYLSLLKAFAEFVQNNKDRQFLLGIRQNFNGIGTEHLEIPEQNRDLKQWIVPERADKSIALQPWSAEVGATYERLVLDHYIKLFSHSVRIFVRNNISSKLESEYKQEFESGRLGWFHTSSELEPHAPEPGINAEDVEMQYRRFIEYCRSGKTLGYTEPWASAWGHHAKTDDRWCSPPQWFYWTQLNNLHCGVSFIGIYSSDMQVALDGTYRGGGLDYRDGPGRNYQQEFIATLLFANRYVGFHHRPAQSPGAWVAFRENHTILAANGVAEAKRKLKTHTGDYNFLMERLPDQSRGEGITNIGPDEKRFGAWARVLPAGEPMRLRLDPAFLKSCENNGLVVRLTYYDAKGKDFDVILNDVPHRVECQGRNQWETKVIAIKDGVLKSTDGLAHITLRNGAADLYLHMVEVTRSTQ